MKKKIVRAWRHPAKTLLTTSSFEEETLAQVPESTWKRLEAELERLGPHAVVWEYTTSTHSFGASVRYED